MEYALYGPEVLTLMRMSKKYISSSRSALQFYWAMRRIFCFVSLYINTAGGIISELMQ